MDDQYRLLIDELRACNESNQNLAAETRECMYRHQHELTELREAILQNTSSIESVAANIEPLQDMRKMITGFASTLHLMERGGRLPRFFWLLAVLLAAWISNLDQYVQHFFDWIRSK